MMVAKTKENGRRGRQRRADQFVHPVKINRTGRRIGWYQSVTTMSSHPFHSMNEFHWLHFLDVLPGVVDFKAQPITFDIPGEPKPQRYTPDTEVVVADGSVIYVEVKPLKEVKTDRFQKFLDLVQPVFLSHGTELHVVTDEVVKNPIIWRNLREIHRQRHLIPDEGIALQLEERLQITGRMVIGDLLDLHTAPTLLYQTILSLILRKRLSVDFSIPLDESSVVFLPNPDFNPFSKDA